MNNMKVYFIFTLLPDKKYSDMITYKCSDLIGFQKLLYLILYNHIWYFIILYVQKLLYMIVCGHKCIVMYDHIWLYLVIHEHMIIFEYLFLGNFTVSNNYFCHSYTNIIFFDYIWYHICPYTNISKYFSPGYKFYVIIYLYDHI